MPTYQYACIDPACDHRFEQFQSFTDAALTQCPICSGRLRKVYGSVGVVFKGSGFYRNDSRDEINGAKKKSADKEAASSATDSSNSKDSSSNTDSATSSSGGKASLSTTTSTDKPAAKAETSSTSSGNSRA